MTRLWPGGHPRLAAARTLLGRILIEGGRPGEAEPELVVALGDPESARVQLTRALVDLGSGPGRTHPLRPRLERDLAALGRPTPRSAAAGPVP